MDDKSHPTFKEGMAMLYAYLAKLHPLSKEFKTFISGKMTGFYTGTKYLKKEIQGTIADEGYFIIQGFCRFYSLNSDNQELTFSFTEANEGSVAEDSFFNQVPCKFNIEFGPNTYVLQITYEKLQQIRASFPESEILSSMVLAARSKKAEQRSRIVRGKSGKSYERFKA